MVIVNYRTAELTTAAARSVLAEDDVGEVVVVDNASGDGSAATLREALGDDPRARVVGSPRNGGFGAGVNLGVAACAAPFLFILNSDATVRPGSVGRLVTALAADGSLGILAPEVVLADGVTPQPQAFGRLPRRWELVVPGWRTAHGGRRADALRPEWVSGVAMVLRTADFLALGGFDEAFEMYFEDLDLCRRVMARGQAVGRLPAAQVVHGGGQSWRSARDQKRRYHESRLTYARKVGARPVELRLIRATGRLRVALAAR